MVIFPGESEKMEITGRSKVIAHRYLSFHGQMNQCACRRKKRMLLAILLLFADSSASAPQASDYFTICHKSDAKFEQCLLKSLEELRPLLRKGSKELKIPSVEPMIVPMVSVKQGSGPVSIDSTFNDLHVSGITNYEVVRVKPDLEKGRLEINVEIPYLYMEGDYEIKGKILVLPINGNGFSYSNYTGVSGAMVLKMTPVERSGESYIKLEKLTFDIKVKKATINMNNLFNGNKELGDAMNRFMSSNWEVVFQELKPVIDSAVSAILEGIAAKVLDKFPASQLFPE